MSLKYKPIVFGVAGGTASGKTTVARAVLEAVGASQIAYLPHDAYYSDRDDLPFEDAQYLGLVDLVRLLCAQYPIAAVVGHSDIAPGRKTDPGPCFDWRRLGSIGNLPGKLR